MKRKLLFGIVVLCLAILVAFTSCAPEEPLCTMHFDIDKDGICDFCDEELEAPGCDNHRDENDDGLCDNGGESYTDGCDNHRDENDDGKCDNGGESYTDGCDNHRDENDDGKCDNGGESYTDGCDNHRDENDDGKCDNGGESYTDGWDIPETPALTYQQPSIPEYSGTLKITLNGGIPSFTEQQLANIGSYEYYSVRDNLGRCGIAVAFIGTDIMPTDSRGSISSVTPTGWQSGFYERSHLIAWQLTGENANWENLISGTDDLNAAMQVIEESVAAYLNQNINNHVLYRVVPIFEGDNLLATGVHMEAYSVEDNGAGVCFNYFIYNVEADYEIDYSDGSYKLKDDAEILKYNFVINKGNNKVHTATCPSVKTMSASNTIYSDAETWQELCDRWSEYKSSGSPVVAGCCKPNTNPHLKASLRLTILPAALLVVRKKY